MYKSRSKIVRAFLRMSNYLDQNNKNLLHWSMIKSQFSYCPLVWMYCSKQSNNLVWIYCSKQPNNSTNKLQERLLRITDDHHQSSFQDLIPKYIKCSIHER